MTSDAYRMLEIRKEKVLWSHGEGVCCLPPEPGQGQASNTSTTVSLLIGAQPSLPSDPDHPV